MIPLWTTYRMLEQQGENMTMTYALGVALLVIVVWIIALALHRE